MAHTCVNHICGVEAKPDGAFCSTGTCLDGGCIGQSCQGLAANCGVNHDENCCSTATTLPGGETFFRDYDAAPDQYNGQAWPATVSSFRLDKFEVTVGRFRNFVQAYDAWRTGTPQHPVVGEGGDPHVVPSGATAWDAAWSAPAVLAATATLLQDNNHIACGGYQTWVASATASSETRAMNCVSWYEAAAFCLWDGGWLPTEAEWMYAATGGAEGRAYPWSDPPSSTNIDATFANYVGGSGHVDAVGSHHSGAGRWGHEDLAGNLWEWTWDYYVFGYAAYPCDNCTYTSPSAQRVIRGGCFNQPADILRSAKRGGGDIAEHYDPNGFRCARLP